MTDRSDTAPATGFSWYVLAVISAAALGGLLYGFVLSVIAGAETAIADQFHLGHLKVGLVVSNLDLGAAGGALAAGLLGDQLGRKRTILATAALYLGSSILTALAPGVSAILVGRLLAGLAVGASLILPLFVAEISPARRRGLLVALVQVAIVLGILLAYVVSWLLVDAGPAGWRWMFAVGILPATAFLLLAAFLPESPRWLVSRGMTREALAILTRLEGSGRAVEAVEEIRLTVRQEAGGWKEVLRPAHRRALKVGLLVSVASVGVGINAVILYGPAILIRNGHGLSEALAGSILLGVVNLVATMAAVPWIDRLGRRPLLLVGLAGTALSMTGLGASFTPAAAGAATGSAWALLSILAFIAFYAMSLGPITWVLIAEIFPTPISSPAMALCLVAMYLADFVVTLCFPSLMAATGRGGFFCFAAVSVVAAVLVARFLPETKGRTLEQVHRSWTE
jgi:SP family arabinose:H+ symporter-like MFS transporter